MSMMAGIRYSGIKVWEGYLSAAVVKAIVENKMGKELGAIGELLSEMDDEDRSELGDMDYAVGAQKVSEEDGDILLLPAGVQMLRKLVAPIVKIGAKLKVLREAQVELRRSAEDADAMREAQGVIVIRWSRMCVCVCSLRILRRGAGMANRSLFAHR